MIHVGRAFAQGKMQRGVKNALAFFDTPCLFFDFDGGYAKKIGCIVWDAGYNIEIITGAVMEFERT